jgi:hypothetical protein
MEGHFMKKLLPVFVLTLLTTVASAQIYRAAIGNTRFEDALNARFCRGLFQSTHGTIIDIQSQVSVNGHLNILNWLQGRIAGLQIYNNRAGVPFAVIRGGVPAIFIDEMPVDYSALNSLPVNDIAMIKVIKTPFLGGPNGGHGAVAVYTRRGDEFDTGDDTE